MGVHAAGRPVKTGGAGSTSAKDHRIKPLYAPRLWTAQATERLWLRRAFSRLSNSHGLRLRQIASVWFSHFNWGEN